MTVLTPSASDRPDGRTQDRLTSRALLGWHRRHARPLRFRGTADPWAVLVSEVMSQQTRIARVEVAWASFMERFPTVHACADAETADVVRAWAGLGYNRRAVQLHGAARTIVIEHEGRVPSEVSALEGLPGVGPYTARAVAAIAFGRPVAAIDTNIRRLVGRLVGAPEASGSLLQARADAMVDPQDPAGWTHAAMDLGASICVPRQPRCDACPLRAWCTTGGAGRPVSSRGVRKDRNEGVPFESTSRWLRGRIVAGLRDLDRGDWASAPARLGSHDGESIAAAVEGLVRDGLVERRTDGALRLPMAS